jgi:hypothetical protein
MRKTLVGLGHVRQISGGPGHPGLVRIPLDGAVTIYDGEECAAQNVQQPAAQGGVTAPITMPAGLLDVKYAHRKPDPSPSRKHPSGDTWVG